jgi:hypothetical protein
MSAAPANAFEAPPKVELTEAQAKGASPASHSRALARPVRLGAFAKLREKCRRRPLPPPLADALTKTIAVLKQPENAAKMDAAKAQMMMTPEPNVMMLMMVALPVATRVIAPVLGEFGFPVDQGGLMMFMGAVMKHKDNAEIAAMGKEMRASFVPDNLADVVNAMLSGGAPGA